VALLDHLKIDRAYLIGGCMGCSVALTIGARYSQRVSASARGCGGVIKINKSIS